MTADNNLIRPMKNEDLEQVLSWRNHPDVRRCMYSQHEITKEEHSNWFERCQRDPLRHLLIFEHQQNASGFIHFTCQNHQKIADWGFYLSPLSPSGTGRLLGEQALKYAFHTLHLHKVCGEAIDYNDKSIRFHLRMGFQQEGLLRDQFYDGQNYHSIIRFGLLADEWSTRHIRDTQL